MSEPQSANVLLRLATTPVVYLEPTPGFDFQNRRLATRHASRSATEGETTQRRIQKPTR